MLLTAATYEQPLGGSEGFQPVQLRIVFLIVGPKLFVRCVYARRGEQSLLTKRCEVRLSCCIA